MDVYSLHFNSLKMQKDMNVSQIKNMIKLTQRETILLILGKRKTRHLPRFPLFS